MSYRLAIVRDGLASDAFATLIYQFLWIIQLKFFFVDRNQIMLSFCQTGTITWSLKNDNAWNWICILFISEHRRADSKFHFVWQLVLNVDGMSSGDGMATKSKSLVCQSIAITQTKRFGRKLEQSVNLAKRGYCIGRVCVCARVCACVYLCFCVSAAL